MPTKAEPLLDGFANAQRALTLLFSALTGNQSKNATFNQVLRQNGIFKSPGKLYPCLAITEDDLAITKQAIEIAVSALD